MSGTFTICYVILRKFYKLLFKLLAVLHRIASQMSSTLYCTRDNVLTCAHVCVHTHAHTCTHNFFQESASPGCLFECFHMTGWWEDGHQKSLDENHLHKCTHLVFFTFQAHGRMWDSESDSRLYYSQVHCGLHHVSEKVHCKQGPWEKPPMMTWVKADIHI